MSAQHTLTIQTRHEAVAVERLLQVTRYRGFTLAGLELKPLADVSGLLITLSVVSDKPISLLVNQLNKLYDVLIWNYTRPKPVRLGLDDRKDLMSQTGQNEGRH